ncbi:5'-AMP-activated protein kinase subunit beta-2-like [Protopterus annectens]|uniref:5'-AMP-activated protein kinase subunit beta-2-like n=1 Tax=Protopterus annectens TaxID=7888 RepID=UPI001CFBB9A7|nr:5'-AMP-activated protein kinase subunit beta-2-like [Protopterus annectens]XP_043913540.1 5'-AMP-activated protein kinase subunit beta-2-like [Protopterus annectens]XP_043913541.1 5'-AMP-activated protein kinase subunit beta-2-like [Protopterus annectens]
MGNTASDRAPGDRHGGKSQRGDGTISQAMKEQEPNKGMTDSTDDPNIFNMVTQESKPHGEKEFTWQPEAEDGLKPSQQARPTVIRWAEGGKEVFISGSFNNWNQKIPLIKR